MVTTGEIWLVQLDPTIGSEIQKNNALHDHLRTVIVAPMTTGLRPAAFRIPLTFKGKTGLILLDQIRTVDKTRLVKREGAIQSATLKRTLTTLQILFAPT
jgi:mRNA interferase MazF